MLRYKAVFGGLLALSATACVTSDQSFVPPRAAVFAPDLLGTWTNNDKERAVVTKEGDTRYRVAYTDDGGKTTPFIGTLANVGERRVLDLENLEPRGKDDNGGRHLMLVLTGRAPRVTAFVLERDTLDAYLKRHPAAIASRRIKEETVLTAAPEAVHAFLDVYLKQPGVLGDSSVWTRRAP